MSGNTKFNPIDWDTVDAAQQQTAVLAALKNTAQADWNQWQLQKLEWLLKTAEGFTALLADLLVFWNKNGPVTTIVFNALCQLSDAEFQKIEKTKQQEIRQLFAAMLKCDHHTLLKNLQIDITKIQAWQREPFEAALLSMDDLNCQALSLDETNRLAQLFYAIQDSKKRDPFGLSIIKRNEYEGYPDWLKTMWLDFLIKNNQADLVQEQIQASAEPTKKFIKKYLEQSYRSYSQLLCTRKFSLGGNLFIP